MTTIIPCPDCQILASNGRVHWHCTAYHPELLTWLDLALLSALLALPVLILAIDKKKASSF